MPSQHTNSSQDDTGTTTSQPIEHPLSGEAFTTQTVYCGLHDPESRFHQEFKASTRVELAKQVDQQVATDAFSPSLDIQPDRGTILETVNSEDLATFSPAGRLYKMGDTITINVKPSTRGWGTSSKSKREYTEPIDYIGPNSVGIPRMPTYSNPPSDSPSARFGKHDIKIVERSDLDKYRSRLQPGGSPDVPESINGWKLEEVEKRDTDLSCVPNDIITKIKWANPNASRTTVTAQWRGGYSCWYLSTPTSDGTLSERNQDEYMYEIDVPHRIIEIESIIGLASEYMEAIPATDFQDGYDLRDPDVADDVKDRYDSFAPIDIPEQIGPWKIAQREAGKITWRAEESKWSGFKVSLTNTGGYQVVYSPKDDDDTVEHHDARHVRKFYPSGDPSPKNIDCDYRWQRRDMFDEQWHHVFGFLIQTGGHRVSGESINEIEAQIDDDIDLRNIDHGCCDDPMKTKSGGMTLNDF